MFFKLLDKIRKMPDASRHLLTLGVSIAVTAIIATVWAFTFVPSLGRALNNTSAGDLTAPLNKFSKVLSGNSATEDGTTTSGDDQTNTASNVSADNATDTMIYYTASSSASTSKMTTATSSKPVSKPANAATSTGTSSKNLLK